MNILQQQHLSDEILSQIVLGVNNSVDWEQHLEECEECIDRASRLSVADTFVELLASAKTRLDFPQPAVPASSDCLKQTPVLSATLGYPPSSTPYKTVIDLQPEFPVHPKYRPIRKLGSGGMGSVWLAEHQMMHRLVAVKSIRPEFLNNPTARERFLREIRAIAQLDHPNIVTSYDAEQGENTCLLTMEYIPGEVLATTLERGPMPMVAACQAVRDAALGLHEAHLLGLVHRDVKPSNLIRTPEGLVKVLDFGLVVATDTTGSGLTAANVVMGTADYIAPEQAENPKFADARSDIYSLGCTFYHLLSGQLPYPEESTLKVLDAHRFKVPNPIPQLPTALDRILNCMMAKNPADRFPTALAVAEALEPFCEGTTPGSDAVSVRRSPWHLRFLIALVVVLTGISAQAVVQHRIRTDTGELVIETVDDDVEVLIKQGGKVITIHDPKTQQKVILQSGAYEIELNGKRSGLKLDIDRTTLKRGDVVIARITRVPLTSHSNVMTQPTAALDSSTAIEPAYVIAFSEGGRFGTTDISPDGSLIIATRSDVDLARLYDAASGKVIRELPNSFIAKFAAAGKQIITGDYSVIRVFDVETGKLLRQFSGGDHLWNLYPAVTGTTLYARFPRQAQIWDWSNGKKISEFPLFDELDQCLLSVDGKQFFRQCYGRSEIEEFDAVSGTKSEVYPALRTIRDRMSSFSMDGKRLICHNDTALIIYNLTTGQEISRCSVRQSVTTTPKSLSPNSRILGLTRDRYLVGVYDPNTGTKGLDLHAPRSIDDRYELRLSASGTTATLALGQSVYVWKLPGPDPQTSPSQTTDAGEE